jgi:hypothetical protein
MLNNISRSWVIGGWCATLAVIVAGSVAIGASASTSALFLVMGVAPAIVIALIGGSGPSQTVAEILHSVDAKDGRR